MNMCVGCKRDHVAIVLEMASKQTKVKILILIQFTGPHDDAVMLELMIRGCGVPFLRQIVAIWYQTYTFGLRAIVYSKFDAWIKVGRNTYHKSNIQKCHLLSNTNDTIGWEIVNLLTNCSEHPNTSKHISLSFQACCYLVQTDAQAMKFPMTGDTMTPLSWHRMTLLMAS